MAVIPRCISAVLLALGLWGCGPSAPDSEGDAPNPPLLDAAEHGDLNALDALLGHAPDPDVRNACQWTPLMKAAQNGHREAVLRLLAAGAQIDAEDSGGYTAMMLAAGNNHLDVVDLLISSGAMVDHQERTRGWTALIWATTQGHTSMVERLLRDGADRTLKDTSGKTAADWARKKRQDAALALLNTPRGDGSQATPVGSRHAEGYDSAHAEPARQDGPARVRVE